MVLGRWVGGVRVVEMDHFITAQTFMHETWELRHLI